MAVDKSVDSAQLDAALSAVADAIRTKGGTSAQLSFPAGFVSAIDAIPTGGGGDTLEIKGTRDVAFAWRSDYPKKCKIITDILQNISFKTGNDQAELETTKYIEEVEVAEGTGTGTGGLTFTGDFRYNGVYALKKIDLNFVPLLNIYSCTFVYGANKDPDFEDFLGLNFMLVGGANYRIGNFGNMGALKNVTCKPNTLGQLDMVATNRNWWNLSASSLLTDTSLCQIANALCATHTSTLTLHATPKARCQSLMGTVSSVTDDTGTYDFFTADANGTVSLADFITQTKGWTLA